MDYSTMPPPARLLFRSSLVIFLVTIVIGILNGLDVWDPPREMILTHVHAGTLGWITLAVIGVAVLMFGDAEAASAHRLAQGATGATVLYVITFATTTGVFRPIAGTLMLPPSGRCGGSSAGGRSDRPRFPIWPCCWR